MKSMSGNYSKAYYNKRKRNTVTLSIERVTPVLCKFIFKNNIGDYYKLFNDLKVFTTTEHLDEDIKKVNFIVLRNPLKRIRAYAIIGSNKLIGDYNELIISNEDANRLRTQYNIELDNNIIIGG